MKKIFLVYTGNYILEISNFIDDDDVAKNLKEVYKNSKYKSGTFLLVPYTKKYKRILKCK